MEKAPPLIASRVQNSALMNQTNQNTAPDLEPLIDDEELARVLDVADGTPGNWRRAKPPRGPAYITVEGVIRYAPADVRSYLASRRRQTSESEAA
jgi:hypothetical protein